MTDKTRKISFSREENSEMKELLTTVYEALV